MAIQNNIPEADSRYGIAFNNAYYRIMEVVIHRTSEAAPKFSVVIGLAVYATSSPTERTRQVDQVRYEASLDDVEAKTGSTFIEKCYAWVMDQDDMTGSTAV